MPLVVIALIRPGLYKRYILYHARRRQRIRTLFILFLCSCILYYASVYAYLTEIGNKEDIGREWI